MMRASRLSFVFLGHIYPVVTLYRDFKYVNLLPLYRYSLPPFDLEQKRLFILQVVGQVRQDCFSSRFQFIRR